MKGPQRLVHTPIFEILKNTMYFRPVFLPPRNRLPSRRPQWTDTQPTNIIFHTFQWRDEQKLASVVSSSLMEWMTPLSGNQDSTYLSYRRYWALLNRVRTNQFHCASCRKKWGPCSNPVFNLGISWGVIFPSKVFSPSPKLFNIVSFSLSGVIVTL